MKTTKTTILLGLVSSVIVAACGPSFDPASLIESTRVLGAQIQVEGASGRATPMPGETADVTWLVTSPGAAPPLAWAFVTCLPEADGGATSLRCTKPPLARFDGTTSPPQIPIAVPSAAALGSATSLVVYGQICAGASSSPVFDPQTGLAGCTDGHGSTVSLEFPLQLGAEANHNPVADRAYTLDGQPWPALTAGDDPCALGPRVVAGSTDHVIGDTTDARDRETYTAVAGDPPAATPAREQLQISQFTTTGKLKSQFSFVESTDDSPATTVEVTWDAPALAEVPAAGLPVTFTFVVRDDRGGADWTARTLCVTP